MQTTPSNASQKKKFATGRTAKKLLFKYQIWVRKSCPRHLHPLPTAFFSVRYYYRNHFLAHSSPRNIKKKYSRWLLYHLQWKHAMTSNNYLKTFHQSQVNTHKHTLPRFFHLHVLQSKKIKPQRNNFCVTCSTMSDCCYFQEQQLRASSIIYL